MAEVIRVVIVEDHVLMREALVELLKLQDSIEVAAAVGDGHRAVTVAAELRPDVILLDVEIPGDEVATTISRIQDVSPDTKILILSMHDSPQLVRRLVDLGVRGYLLKNAGCQQLVAAIHVANADDIGIVLFVSRKSLASFHGGQSKVLSLQERAVLVLVAGALSNAQVAARLGVTEATVKRHLHNAFAKLGAVSRIDAVNKAVAAAQIPPP
jgi:DNA-binding NarL/FixJ family response regulator